MPASTAAKKATPRARTTRAPTKRNTVPAETPNPLHAVPTPAPMTSFGGVAIAGDQPEKKTVAVITQIKEAWKNKPAFITGNLFGAAIPGADFYGAHFEIRPALMEVLTTDSPWYVQLRLAVLCAALVGGSYVSAKTVYRWGQSGFIEEGRPDSGKALGLVLVLNIWMLLASNIWFAACLLLVLLVVNGLGTGCNFALNAKAERSRR